MRCGAVLTKGRWSHATARTFVTRWVLARVLHDGVGVLEKQKKYAEAAACLRLLLSTPFCPGKRGHWWHRLSLNVEHMGRKKHSLILAETALDHDQPSLRLCDQLVLQKRVLKLAKPPLRWNKPSFLTRAAAAPLSSPFPAFSIASLKKPRSTTIYGRLVREEVPHPACPCPAPTILFSSPSLLYGATTTSPPPSSAASGGVTCVLMMMMMMMTADGVVGEGSGQAREEVYVRGPRREPLYCRRAGAAVLRTRGTRLGGHAFGEWYLQDALWSPHVGRLVCRRAGGVLDSLPRYALSSSSLCVPRMIERGRKSNLREHVTWYLIR